MPFAVSSIQRLLSYRINFFLFFLGNILRAFVTYAIWLAVYEASGHSSGLIQGFSLADMTVYVFLSFVVQEVIHSEADWTIANEVLSGRIAINLVRPISYQWRLLFENLGANIYNFFVRVMPVWLILHWVLWQQYEIGIPGLLTLSLFLLSLVFSFFILFFLNLCFGFLAFYTTKIWGLTGVKYILIEFFSGAVVPLSFFPLWAQNVMDYFPFRSMLYDPMLIYLGKIPFNEIGHTLLIQLFWVSVMGLLSLWVWNSSIRRLTILGG